MPEQPHDHLDQARIDAGLSHSELWLHSFELGAMGGPVEVEASAHGVLFGSDHEHGVLVHAINERVIELGGNHPVPSSDD